MRPETAGGGVASTTGASQRLSRPVEMRLFHTSWVATTASSSLSTCAPVRPETGMTRVPLSCGSSRSASARNCCALPLLSSTRSHLLRPMTSARPSRSTRSAIVRSCFSNGIVASSSSDDDFGEAHGAQRVGGGELLQLLDDAGPAAQARGVEQLDAATAPGQSRGRCCRASGRAPARSAAALRRGCD